MTPPLSAHEFDIEEFGECLTCGSDDVTAVCAAPGNECDECGAWCAGALCATCERELGGES